MKYAPHAVGTKLDQPCASASGSATMYVSVLSVSVAESRLQKALVDCQSAPALLVIAVLRAVESRCYSSSKLGKGSQPSCANAASVAYVQPNTSTLVTGAFTALCRVK
eukprot:5192-Heterococcus_DN1.PRE.6